MNRPIYETNADLERESEVAGKCEQAWNGKMTKLPIKYHLDYVFTRQDKAIGFCEMKTRNYPMDDLDRNGGYSLSLHKWMSAKHMHEATGLPFVLIVKLRDGLYYSRFGTGENPFVPDDMVVSGRIDRNDAQDIEPCVMIRAKRFKKLKD
jgi:hypothetical protein